MSGLWRKDERILNGQSQLVGASATNQEVSQVFRITPEGAKDAMRIEVGASLVTSTTGITAKLQHFVNNAWTDVASVAITVNGFASILINGRDTASGYFSQLPLGNKGRVVISSGVGDTVTIDSVLVTMED
jgi:hypothetical protein